MEDISTRKKQIKSMHPIFVKIYLWHRKSMELQIIKTSIQTLLSGGMTGEFYFLSGVDTIVIVLLMMNIYYFCK